MRARIVIVLIAGAVILGLVAYKLVTPTRNRLGHILVFTGKGETSVSWSSDSSALYFFSESSGMQRIVRYDIRTRRHWAFTIGENRGFVGLSPDEKSMLMVSFRGRIATGILIRNLVTGNEQMIYRFRGRMEHICWPRPRHIVFRENNHVFTIDEQGQHLTKLVGRESECYDDIVFRKGEDYYARNQATHKDIKIPVPSGSEPVFILQSERQLVYFTQSRRRPMLFDIATKKTRPIQLPLQESGGTEFPPSISPDRTKLVYCVYSALSAFNSPPRFYLAEIPKKTRQILGASP